MRAARASATAAGCAGSARLHWTCRPPLLAPRQLHSPPVRYPALLLRKARMASGKQVCELKPLRNLARRRCPLAGKTYCPEGPVCKTQGPGNATYSISVQATTYIAEHARLATSFQMGMTCGVRAHAHLKMSQACTQACAEGPGLAKHVAAVVEAQQPHLQAPATDATGA